MFLSISRQTNDVSLTFQAKAWRTYTIEYRGQAEAEPWLHYTNLPAAPTNRWEGFTEKVPPEAPHRFFRLRLP